MPLGLFQFENLLRQRVGFYIFTMVDLSVLGYKSMEKMHLEAITTPVPVDLNIEQLLQLMTDKKLDTTAPILLICNDGEKSRALASALDEKNYLNVFWALDGLNGLLREKNPA